MNLIFLEINNNHITKIVNDWIALTSHYKKYPAKLQSNINKQKFFESAQNIQCNSCRAEYIDRINNGWPLKVNKNKISALNKKVRNIITNLHQFEFTINNFSERIKKGQFDVVEKHDCMFLCPVHLVLKNPNVPEKFFRIVNNGSYADHYSLSINELISKEDSTVQLPGIEDYARMIVHAAKKTGCAYANITDLTSAFHQLVLRFVERGYICFRLCGVYLRARVVEWGVRPASALCQKLATYLIWIYENCTDNKNKPYCKPHQKGATTVHIDDFIQVAPDEYECIEMGDGLKKCFNEHGIDWSPSKSAWNQQNIKHHGLLWDLKKLLISVPPKKIKWVIKAIDGLLKLKCATVRLWYKLAGKLMYFAGLFKPTKALISNLIWYIYELINNNKLKKSDIIIINEQIIFDLMYWKKFAVMLSNIPIVYLLKQFNFSFSFSVDACMEGFGIYYQGNYVSFPFPLNVSHWHINEKETFAILIALNTFGPQWSGLQGKCFSDNFTAIYAFKNKWARNPRIMACVYYSCLLLLHYKILIYVDYINTKLNKVADLLSRSELNKLKQICMSFNIPLASNPTIPNTSFNFEYAEYLFQKKKN